MPEHEDKATDPDLQSREGPQLRSDTSSGGVGAEIRAMRRARRMTLKDLARSAELSVGFISLVERGQKRPSLDALQRISKGLGIEVGWLFPSSPGGDLAESAFVVRKDYRRRINYSRLAGTHYLGETDFLLSPAIDGQLVMSIMRFSPGGHSGDNLLTHEGEEAGFVLSGVLTLEVDDNTFVLEKGDSFGFSGAKPHRYANHGTTDLEIILANTPVIMASR